MQVIMRGITGRYATPVYGGEWTTGRTMLAYSPLFLLPLKKGIIDGNPILHWLMPIPVEWLIERDWWIQTHWEDNDSREVYRQLLRKPDIEGYDPDGPALAGLRSAWTPYTDGWPDKGIQGAERIGKVIRLPHGVIDDANGKRAHHYEERMRQMNEG